MRIEIRVYCGRNFLSPYIIFDGVCYRMFSKSQEFYFTSSKYTLEKCCWIFGGRLEPINDTPFISKENDDLGYLNACVDFTFTLVTCTALSRPFLPPLTKSSNLYSLRHHFSIPSHFPTLTFTLTKRKKKSLSGTPSLDDTSQTARAIQ